MEEEEAPSLFLESPSHRKEPALISSSEEPAEDFVHSESEGNVSTSSGRQVKPVQKDGMYYYYCLFNMLLGCQYNQFYMIIMFYVRLLKIIDSYFIVVRIAAVLQFGVRQNPFPTKGDVL